MDTHDSIHTHILSNPSSNDLLVAARALQNGELVAIPTETVYGLGANGLDAEAMDKIYAAKGRPSDNPLILHVPSIDSIRPLVKAIPKTAYQLMETFWPGPLTITLPKSDLVPYRATGGLERVALRCPDHDICRQLLSLAGVPIAAPSANISGRPSPTTAQAVYEDMNGRILYIVDAGPCSIGVESTVVEVQEDAVIILRPGGITKEMLETVVSTVTYDKALSSDAKPKAPGMKYKHYAPDAPMTAFVGNAQDVAIAIDKYVHSLTRQQGENVSHDCVHIAKACNVGYLLSKEVYEALQPTILTDVPVNCIHVYGQHGDAVSLAHDFYSALLSFNEAKVTHIIAEGVQPEGLGVAVMNRMEKASGGHIEYL